MIKIVRFTASWCKPCQSFAPIFNELAQEFGGKASFSTIDIDENVEIAKSYNVNSIPQVLFFKDDKLEKRIVGTKPISDYRNTINSL